MSVLACYLCVAFGIMSAEVSKEGGALFKKGDYVGALQKYKAALEMPDADAVTLHRNMGLVYLKLGLPSEALMSCNACLKIDPKDEKARYRCTQVY